MAHAYMGIALLITAFHLFRAPLVAELVRVTLTFTAVVAVLVGLHYNRPRHRAPWILFAIALMIFELEQLTWVANILAGDEVAGPVGNSLDVAGFMVLMAGAILALRARTRRDIGGVVDSAIMGIAAGTVIWEVLVFGRLTTVFHLPAPALAAELVQVLICMAGLGILIRLAQTSARTPPTLWYLFGTVAGGFVQEVISPLVSTTTARVPGSLLETANLLAVLCISAAALHPSMVQLTEPGPAVADRLSVRRLLLLGTALAAGPLSMGVGQLLGKPADPVLLVVGALVLVPLVMFRIRGLFMLGASAQAALEHQALHDSLTGLPNRAHFLGLLDAALDRLDAGETTQVAVLFCDLDGFKHVNDSLGHSAGDELLVAVAQRLRYCIRAEDVVSRFGGDEFLIVCEDLTEREVAERICARIAAELEQPVRLGDIPVTVSASIGVAATTTGGMTADEIIRRADQAMYSAKVSSSTRPRLGSARPLHSGAVRETG